MTSEASHPKQAPAILLALCLLPFPSMATTPPANQTPATPAETQKPSTTKPQVTIRREKDRTIEEYRVNGQLVISRITPTNGPVYFMLDTNNDGVLDTRYDNLDNLPNNPWMMELFF